MSIPERMSSSDLPGKGEPTFVHLSTNKDGTTKMQPLDPRAERFFIEDTEQTRTQLQALATNTDGLNMERLHYFREQMNALKTPIQFLDTDSYESVLQKRERKSDPEGLYIAELRMAFVRRNMALEALNSTAITESFAVHEAAHSSRIETPIRVMHTTIGRLFKKSVIEMSQSRSGYNVMPASNNEQPYGYTLEEGYAELERGLYVQSHDLVGHFTAGAANYELVKESPIPLHYWFKREENERVALTIAPGALAATVLEILMKHDDSLFATLRESRQNIHGLRSTAQSINGLMPGLYSELQHANESDIIDILASVIKHFR